MAAITPKTFTKTVLVNTPIAKTATGNETNIVDTKGWRYATFYALLGAVSGTTPTLVINIREGAASNLSDAAAITGATTGTLNASNANTMAMIGQVDLTQSRLRYMGVTNTIGGTTPSFLLGIVCVLSHPLDTALATDTHAFGV